MDEGILALENIQNFDAQVNGNLLITEEQIGQVFGALKQNSDRFADIGAAVQFTSALSQYEDLKTLFKSLDPQLDVKNGRGITQNLQLYSQEVEQKIEKVNQYFANLMAQLKR